MQLVRGTSKNNSTKTFRNFQRNIWCSFFCMFCVQQKPEFFRKSTSAEILLIKSSQVCKNIFRKYLIKTSKLHQLRHIAKYQNVFDVEINLEAITQNNFSKSRKFSREKTVEFRYSQAIVLAFHFNCTQHQENCPSKISPRKIAPDPNPKPTLNFVKLMIL